MVAKATIQKTKNRTKKQVIGEKGFKALSNHCSKELCRIKQSKINIKRARHQIIFWCRAPSPKRQ